MNADQSVPPAAGEWNPGAVQLTLQMDVGTATLSLDELQALQPGYVFELRSSAEAPVTARLNGAAIGEGELIRIGDRLGVRLVKVNRHAD